MSLFEADLTAPVVAGPVVPKRVKSGQDRERQSRREKNRCLKKLREQAAALRAQGSEVQALQIDEQIRKLEDRWSGGFNSRSDRNFRRMETPYFVHW